MLEKRLDLSTFITTTCIARGWCCLGTCVVTKIFRRKSAKPEYFDKILGLYPHGTPCQSSVFADIPDIAIRKNQVEIALCKRSCPPSTHKHVYTHLEV